MGLWNIAAQKRGCIVLCTRQSNGRVCADPVFIPHNVVETYYPDNVRKRVASYNPQEHVVLAVLDSDQQDQLWMLRLLAHGHKTIPHPKCIVSEPVLLHKNANAASTLVVRDDSVDPNTAMYYPDSYRQFLASLAFNGDVFIARKRDVPLHACGTCIPVT